MSFRMGLIGRKVGMSQSFAQTGDWTAYTAVEMGPCVVLDVLNEARNGYSAIKVGFGEQKTQRTTKALRGIFEKAKTTPKRYTREIRLSGEEIGQFAVGDVLTVDQVFTRGMTVDVTGKSVGKGFQGVMKRHHFHGFPASHGTHEYFRHGGSIGCRLTPGRVFKGMRMPGQMGNVRRTVQNIVIHEVLPDKNLLLLKGAVPGSDGGLITVRWAAKRPTPAFVKLSPQAAPEAPAASDAPAVG
jgi:large subunit ribosomal protein L3